METRNARLSMKAHAPFQSRGAGCERNGLAKVVKRFTEFPDLQHRGLTPRSGKPISSMKLLPLLL